MVKVIYKKMVKDSKAYQYAVWCRDETKGFVPSYVKKQAIDWIKIADGNDPDAIVDECEYIKICRFLKCMAIYRCYTLHQTSGRSDYTILYDCNIGDRTEEL